MGNTSSTRHSLSPAHNTFPTMCSYILWVGIVGANVCIVGVYVYIVGDIVHCVAHNIYLILHNTSSTRYSLSPTIHSPQHVPHNICLVLHNIYLVLHNRFPTICYTQYIRVHPQYVTTIYTLYILWVSIVGAYVCIVGAFVYVVGNIVHLCTHNIYVLSTIYTGPVYIVGALPLSPTICTHNIYKHPQCIPTIHTPVYIVGIHCGCFTYILWVRYCCIYCGCSAVLPMGNCATALASSGVVDLTVSC